MKTGPRDSRPIFKCKAQVRIDTHILLAVSALRAMKYGPWMLKHQDTRANQSIMASHNKRIDDAVGWLQSLAGMSSP